MCLEGGGRQRILFVSGKSGVKQVEEILWKEENKGYIQEEYVQYE